MRRYAVVALGAAALATGLIVIAARQAADEGTIARRAFTQPYDNQPFSDGLELLLVQSDGQAFATLARDPSLARPEAFGSSAEAAYRAQRPLLPYLAWAVSLGRPSWVPPVLATLFVVASSAAAAGLARLLAMRAAPVWPAAVFLLLPGAFATLSYFGPEVLALALLTWALVAWTAVPRWTWTAVGLFTLACLARETSAAVPVALALVELRRRSTRDAIVLLLPVAGVLAWQVVLRLRLGAWAFDAGQDRLELPFGGLRNTHWPDPAIQIAAVGLLVAITVWVVVRARTDPLAPVVLLMAATGTILGRAVWADWKFSSRVLLPLAAFGVVAIIGASFGARRPAAGGAGSSRPRGTPTPGRESREVAPVPPSARP